MFLLELKCLRLNLQLLLLRLLHLAISLAAGSCHQRQNCSPPLARRTSSHSPASMHAQSSARTRTSPQLSARTVLSLASPSMSEPPFGSGLQDVLLWLPSASVWAAASSPGTHTPSNSLRISDLYHRAFGFPAA